MTSGLRLQSSGVHVSGELISQLQYGQFSALNVKYIQQKEIEYFAFSNFSYNQACVWYGQLDFASIEITSGNVIESELSVVLTELFFPLIIEQGIVSKI